MDREVIEQRWSKIEAIFSTTRRFTESVTKGSCRFLIVSGPPGIGKTYDVQQVLHKYDPSGSKVTYLTGFTRPSAMYASIHNARKLGSVIVFDDIDSAFKNLDAMNLLKAATDTTPVRRVHYGAQRKDDLPTSFDFYGSVILLTNMNFELEEDTRGKFAEHCRALRSRGQYIRINFPDVYWYLIRIQQVAATGKLLKDLPKAQAQEVLDFVYDNAERMKQLSVRSVVLIGQIRRDFPDDWKNMAAISHFKDTD